MANNNVQNVKFLRNGSVFVPSNDKTARQVALDTMEQQKANLADGTAILGRYQETNGVVKTLVGFAYVSGETKTLTVFDVEGASADVQALREEIDAKLGEGITSGNTATAQLAALSGSSSDASGVTSVWGAKAYADDLISTLDYTDAAVSGSYVSAVNEADGIISVSRVALPDTTTVSGESKVVIDVTQDKGKITATAANLTGVKLAGYSEGTDADIAATDTLGQALGKLQAQINAMDKDASAEDGKVITTVTEVDGKVTETKSNVKDLQLGGYAKTNDTGDIASADTINVALSKLENKVSANAISNDDHSIVVTPQANDDTDIKVNIKSGEKVIKLGDNGIYTDLDLIKITTGLPETVKERYQLLASDDSPIGTNIDIPKDSHIVSITYSGSTQKLYYEYIDVSGETKITEVDMSELVLETEFGSGVTVTDHVAHGVVDTNSETNSGGTAFLTVGADGFKISGIKQEIIDRINELDADLSGNTTHVTVGVKEENGKITAVTVSESDIANKSDLDTLSGKTVTAVEMTGGTAAISAHSDGTKKITINTDGSQILMTGYAKGSDSGAVDSDDSINAAIGKLENQIASKVDALDATVSGETADGKVKVQVVQEDGVLTAVTVTSTDIASDSALTAEISARKAVDGQNGNTYAANTSANYISGATSLNDADVKLDAALKTADDAMITGVTAGNGIEVTTKENKSQTISAKVNGDGGILNDTADGLHLGTIDCGTYN